MCEGGGGEESSVHPFGSGETKNQEIDSVVAQSKLSTFTFLLTISALFPSRRRESLRGEDIAHF